MQAKNPSWKIVCIGAGKLAHQLMPELEKAGCRVIQIYNRSLFGATSLARVLKAASIETDISKIDTTADVYFITVSDDAIAAVANEVKYLENDHCIFVHSSGIQPLEILPFTRRGIFYPLQSFSPGHAVDWKTTPLLITAESDDIRTVLKEIASAISGSVHTISDKDKAVLHLSAVFANNFTNHMLTLAESMCKAHHVSFDILKPLIRETIEKALDVGPSKSQTGPAIRGDEKTIDMHLRMLEGDLKMQKVYKVITESIQERG